MKDDLISRKAAIDALDGKINITGRENAETIRDYINGVSKKLRELPSAERRGRWIHRPVEEWGASNCKCSVCGTENFFPLLLKGGADNYCGNCGARMDGGENG